MQPTTEILERISKDSLTHKEEVFTRLYRYLLRPDIYYQAYQRLYTNKGASTKGINQDTADGFSEAKIEKIIQSLADETYQPTPVRRTYIAKKSNPKKKRPLGIPTFTDKLVQEALRMILEAIYEPLFLDCSHGFRPKRSCHTALDKLKYQFGGVRWFVEGDIKGCFDNINHDALVGFIGSKVKDARIVKLVYKFLKAGYLEDWVYHKTYSGTPQGGILSPLLANIYLHELDKFVMQLKDEFDTPEKGKITPEYRELHNRIKNLCYHIDRTFALELQSLWKEKREEKPKQNQSELKRCQKRYDELSALIRSLYENLMSGLLPERQYKQLMAQYDSEQAELESQMETMKSEIAEDKSSSVDIQHFISLIRKCKNPTEISDSMFNELVDKIVVYEAEGAGNARTQKVDIYFNYVGQVDIAYTEEELAELKAQKEQEERQRLEKQRKREKAYREKRKAKIIAKNGGEIIKTKTCPHCGKVFTPTSNRQLFCSRECWNQARLEQKKADREAEKGNHYYRQRTCAVCGHSYWPTHSQQEFCSDECRRINHNKKTLEFYHKKKGNPKPDPEATPTPKPKEDNAA